MRNIYSAICTAWIAFRVILFALLIFFMVWGGVFIAIVSPHGNAL